MNYNSIDEIFSAGTTNMTVIRNNSKNDDNTDTLTGVSWFTFNNIVASKVYVSGNSWLGFGSTSEHLRVNRRDGAIYYIYREEGTLYDYYKFLKIRVVGYSRYNSTSSSYKIAYDVILWDTGDISLHMINIPSSYNTGTYSLTASSTYSYSVYSSAPDVTFYKTDTGFTVNSSKINLALPVEKRYLIKSDSNYYVINNNELATVDITELSSDSFLNFGMEEFPDISKLLNLNNPEILYWESIVTPFLGEVNIIGIPLLPQIITYEPINIDGYNGIDKIQGDAMGDVIFNVSTDGQNWYYYENELWNAVELNSNVGMNIATMEELTSNEWNELIADNKMIQIRCFLLSKESKVSELFITYLE